MSMSCLVRQPTCLSSQCNKASKTITALSHVCTFFVGRGALVDCFHVSNLITNPTQPYPTHTPLRSLLWFIAPSVRLPVRTKARPRTGQTHTADLSRQHHGEAQGSDFCCPSSSCDPPSKSCRSFSSPDKILSICPVVVVQGEGEGVERMGGL